MHAKFLLFRCTRVLVMIEIFAATMQMKVFYDAINNDSAGESVDLLRVFKENIRSRIIAEFKIDFFLARIDNTI